MENYVKCPNCKTVYYRDLYDFDYIRCTEYKCGTYFDKKTGIEIMQNNKGQMCDCQHRIKAAMEFYDKKVNKKLICNHAMDEGFLCECTAASAEYGRKLNKKWFCENTRQEVQWVTTDELGLDY